MDADLKLMTKAHLIKEVRKLRFAIRQHRDSTEHELCWHHPELWNLLPEKLNPEIAVPRWEQFIRGCAHYRKSLDEQNPQAPRTDTEPTEK